MSSRYRQLLSTISRITVKCRSFQKLRIPKVLPVRAVPYSIGFSFFTWLGVESKLTVEDELVQNIKHCILFIQRLEYEKAEQLLHVTLRQAQQIQHHLGITYIYDVMANLALEREQLDKAKKLFVEVGQRIIADGATENDPRVVHIGVKLARICHLQKEYTTAQLGYDWCINKLTTALSNETNEPNTDTLKILALAEDWYGRMFLDNNQAEMGLKLLISALYRMQTLDDVGKEHIVVQLNDIGTVCDELGRTDESISYFKEAIELAKSVPEMEDLGTTYINLGRAFMKKQLVDEARKSCGYAWKLGAQAKNKTIKDEASLCLEEVKKMINTNM